jgi:hypothetical protein
MLKETLRPTGSEFPMPLRRSRKLDATVPAATMTFFALTVSLPPPSSFASTAVARRSRVTMRLTGHSETIRTRSGPCGPRCACGSAVSSIDSFLP